MAWIAITPDDVATVLTPVELAAHRKLARQTDGSDPVQKVINQVTAFVRGKTAACRRNLLGDDGTIPEELREAALDLIAEKIPAGAGEDKEKTRKAKDARTLLDDVSKCLFSIVNPPTPNASQASGGRIEIARQGPARLRDDDLRGL